MRCIGDTPCPNWRLVLLCMHTSGRKGCQPSGAIDHLKHENEKRMPIRCNHAVGGKGESPIETRQKRTAAPY